MVATLLLVIHILVAALICVVILMQSSKGEGLSGAFGMGQGTTSFFGADTANVLVKITTVLAVIFMLTSLSLAYVQAQIAKSVTAKESIKPQQDSALPTPPGDDENEATAPAAAAGETDTGTGGTDAVAPDGGATTAPPDGEMPETDGGGSEPATGTGESPDGTTHTGPDEPTEPGPTDS